MENLTAKVSCFARAYHYENNKVYIFADSTAKALLGADYDKVAESMSQGIGFFLPDFKGSKEDGLRLIVDKQLSPSVLGRSAYCERMLKNEKQFGCSQYLVFASGYDTFAIRNENGNLSVFELDLPDMITDKKARIENAGLKTNAVYVPCSLAEKEWTDELIKAGFESEKRAFGSLLGISYYLTKEEFKALLKALGEIMSEGSAICFDYPSKDDGKETQTNQALAQGANEQMKAQYSEDELVKILEECGFLIYEHLDHNEMTKQYFADYNNTCKEHKMEAPKGVCYILATKKL
ncbi:MAG: class I SAM-dependent methyltransferase [Clostridiales bacterium]|nr:class I SAM-dependent methyltransferase [Clostridiales bacterium]